MHRLSQQNFNLRVIVFGGMVRCDIAIFVFGRWVGAVFQQHPYDIKLTLPGGEHQGCPTLELISVVGI